MGKVIQFRPREKEEPSLLEATADDLMDRWNLAIVRARRGNLLRFYNLEQKCQKCGQIMELKGGRKLSDTRNIYIRNVNALLYKKAKVRATQEGIPLKEWLQDAMREKLIRDPEPKEEEE